MTAKRHVFLLMEMVFYKTAFWSRRNGGEFIIPKNLIIQKSNNTLTSWLGIPILV